MAEIGKVKHIDIDDIMIDPLQSRMGKWRGDEEDEALVDSMKGVGQIQDVIVRPIRATDKKPYALVAGSRRYHALIKAGKPKIRCIVRDMDDVEAIETSISENIGRKDLTQFEKSEAVAKKGKTELSRFGQAVFEYFKIEVDEFRREHYVLNHIRKKSYDIPDVVYPVHICYIVSFIHQHNLFYV